MDFGNREKVKGADTRPITPALAAVPAQAHQATLAYVKVREVLTPCPGSHSQACRCHPSSTLAGTSLHLLVVCNPGA